MDEPGIGHHFHVTALRLRRAGFRRDARVAAVLAWLLIAAGIAPSPLHAYVDPVSGSLLLQLLAAGFLAITVSFKRVWSKVAGLVRSLKPRGEDD